MPYVLGNVFLCVAENTLFFGTITYYWYDTYGLPKPDNYDELLAKREEERRAMLALAKKAEESKDGNDNDADKKDKGKNLFANLYDFFVKAPPTASGANPDTDF